MCVIRSDYGAKVGTRIHCFGSKGSCTISQDFHLEFHCQYFLNAGTNRKQTTPTIILKSPESVVSRYGSFGVDGIYIKQTREERSKAGAVLRAPPSTNVAWVQIQESTALIWLSWLSALSSLPLKTNISKFQFDGALQTKNHFGDVLPLNRCSFTYLNRLHGETNSNTDYSIFHNSMHNISLDNQKQSIELLCI